MNNATRLAVLGVLTCWFAVGVSGESQAQGISTANNPANFARNYINNRPTVSPYLNLINNAGGSQTSASNLAAYQNQVRPRLEAREQERMVNNQIGQLQTQVNQQGSALKNMQQNGQGAVTGHPTRFMTYMNFYPALNR